MVLNPLTVEMPGNMVGSLMHDCRNITAAAPHMFTALHADSIK
jgi:hypothetical protein